MDDKETQEETTRETEKTPTPKKQEEARSLVERAEAAVENLKSENDRKEKLLNDERELRAKNALGGVTENQPPAQKKEISPAEYAQSLSKGIVLIE